MVDVRAPDQLALPRGQVVKLRPQIGAEGIGAVHGLAGAGQYAILAAVLIQPQYGVLHVLLMESLAHVHVLVGANILLERVYA